jgi:hypothetical protein
VSYPSRGFRTAGGFGYAIEYDGIPVRIKQELGKFQFPFCLTENTFPAMMIEPLRAEAPVLAR